MDKNELRQLIEEALIGGRTLAGGRIGTDADVVMQALEQPFEEARIQSELCEMQAEVIEKIWGQAKLDLDGLRGPQEWPLASKIYDVLVSAPGSISEDDEVTYRSHAKPASLAKELFDLGVKAEALRLERNSLYAKGRKMRGIAEAQLERWHSEEPATKIKRVDDCIAFRAILGS